ncbi:Fur family transcriptional regulator [Geopsychrobacter electrodiphilus]|uniref:Fur family transcriptional regulator n=1 Tax=Geopsychrobacter electrodiphilus TaxID=225196 RepID=UPI00037EA7A8|nr:transcriptional repressor [Geopsychrobacter electrodiphilus]
MKNPEELFLDYLARKRLKNTNQRMIILKSFLRQTRHLSTEDFYLQLRKKHPGIGYATVHRTLKLFAECGIAAERNFGDGQMRFEVSYHNQHHDHLVCTACGRILEFENQQIEELQREVALTHNFFIQDHRLELYGLCSQCHTNKQ